MVDFFLKFGLLFFFTLRLFGVDWAFVTPRIIDPERTATRRNIQKADVGGEVVLLFDRDTKAQVERIRTILDQSQMIHFISSLRTQARDLHYQVYEEFATVDRPATPFMVYYGDAMGKGGPAVASSFRLYLEDESIRSDSLMLLAPIQLRSDELSIQDFIAQDYLVPVVAHEFYHGLMGDIYGDRFLELKVRSTSRVGHAADRVTDEYLAFLEGMAEAMELATLEMFPDEVSHKIKHLEGWSDKKRDFLGKIIKRRLVSARRNHLSLAGDGRKKDGELDSPEDLLRTEGVIATLIYRLIFKSRVEDPFTKVTESLIRHKPLTFLAFLKAFCDDFPEDQKFVYRQFLESTRYITVSDKASGFYKHYYLSKKAYKQKKLSREDYDQVVAEWTDFRTGFYQGVIDGSIAIDQAIRPEFGVSDESFFYELDLNACDDFEIRDFLDELFADLLSEAEIQIHVSKMMKLREDRQWIVSMDSLPFSQAVEERLDSYHRMFEREKERQIQARLETLKKSLTSFVDSEQQNQFSLFFSHHRSDDETQ